MPRRRELKSVAYALLGSFVSRNNDVAGYWGIGQLRRHALLEGCESVEIDLMHRKMSPARKMFLPMMDTFAHMLSKQLASRSLPPEWVRSAKIWITFDTSSDVPIHFETAEDGEPFYCVIHLEDDAGKFRSAGTGGRCRSQNCLRESRRPKATRNLSRIALMSRPNQHNG